MKLKVTDDWHEQISKAIHTGKNKAALGNSFGNLHLERTIFSSSAKKKITEKMFEARETYHFFLIRITGSLSTHIWGKMGVPSEPNVGVFAAVVRNLNCPKPIKERGTCTGLHREAWSLKENLVAMRQWWKALNHSTQKLLGTFGSLQKHRLQIDERPAMSGHIITSSWGHKSQGIEIFLLLF